MAERVALARGLWASDVHEARIAAAKLLTQARIREDEPLVWDEFRAWVPDFDAWAIADHACKAGERRLVAEPARLDVVGGLDARSEHVGPPRRAGGDPALVQAHPPDAGGARGARAHPRLGGRLCVADRDWFIQKAIGWWLRSLSAHDPDRVARLPRRPRRRRSSPSPAARPSAGSDVRRQSPQAPRGSARCRCRAPRR